MMKRADNFRRESGLCFFVPRQHVFTSLDTLDRFFTPIGHQNRSAGNETATWPNTGFATGYYVTAIWWSKVWGATVTYLSPSESPLHSPCSTSGEIHVRRYIAKT